MSEAFNSQTDPSLQAGSGDPELLERHKQAKDAQVAAGLRLQEALASERGAADLSAHPELTAATAEAGKAFRQAGTAVAESAQALAGDGRSGQEAGAPYDDKARVANEQGPYDDRARTADR